MSAEEEFGRCIACGEMTPLDDQCCGAGADYQGLVVMPEDKEGGE